MSITSILAAATAIASIGGAAFAAEPAPRSIAVSYTDLDLARTADQDRLAARIGRAARAVCGVAPAELRQRAQTMDCRTAATADAQAQLVTIIAARAGDTRLAETGGSLTVRAR